LGPADDAVSAHGGTGSAHAPEAGGTRVRAAEARLAALLSGIDRAVAAMDELQLVGADVDRRADRSRAPVEITRGSACRVPRVDRRGSGPQVEVAARNEEQRG